MQGTSKTSGYGAEGGTKLEKQAGFGADRLEV